MRAFLLEEQRIVKKVLKAKAGDAASKEEGAAPATTPAAKEAERGRRRPRRSPARRQLPRKSNPT